LKAIVNILPNCNLCGLCVKYCPTEVFTIEGDKVRAYSERCIYCKACEPLCPQKAVRVELDKTSIKTYVETPYFKTK